MRIGGNSNTPTMRVASDPDGSVTAPRGTTAADSTTGIVWRNRAGGTRWDPVFIPAIYGIQDTIDFEGTNFTTTNIGGGSNADTTPSAAGRIGIRRLTVTAATTDGSNIRCGSVVAVSLGTGRYVFRGALRLVNLSDGTDRLVVRIGGGDAGTFADHTDGVYLECDLATNGSNNWFLCAVSNGSKTSVDTGIAPTAAVFQNVEIRVNAAGTLAEAEIDGVASALTVATNIPVGSSRVFCPATAMALKSLGSTARLVDVDWISYYQVLTTARGV